MNFDLIKQISNEPRVSIIMGSTSDLAIMEKAAKVLDDMGIPFERMPCRLIVLLQRWRLLPNRLQREE